MNLMKSDNIHYTFQKIDSYDKAFNFIISCRGSGKSTAAIRKAYNHFTKTGEPTILVRRNIVDITSVWVDDLETLISKFTDEPVELSYNKGDIKQGIVDIKLDDKILFRVIALSIPMSRLKSYVLRNVAYIIFDEFICNNAIGEKYLKMEETKFKELYTTYNREAARFIKAYFLGNPYSLYNCYFSWLKVKASSLVPGKIIAGNQYAIENYILTDELREYILEHNPLFEFEDEYKMYALGGQNINDSYIKIIETQPQSYCLWLIFKLNGKYIAVFRGEGKLWVRLSSADEFSRNRNLFTFNFRDMSDEQALSANLYSNAAFIKIYMESNRVYYKDIESCYIFEEIYENL